LNSSGVGQKDAHRNGKMSNAENSDNVSG
jgi:hypothetical protein